jgi:hypothetical protein
MEFSCALTTKNKATQKRKMTLFISGGAALPHQANIEKNYLFFQNQ